MEPFNKLTIYRSSAGSGKTYTLVKDYLKLALNDPASFKQILAITFTNKATDEMKNRIVKTLVNFTEPANTKLKGNLLDDLKIHEKEIEKRAVKLLQLILHDYSNFAVCTIDSFFNRIIRSLAKEMGIPMKFDTELNQHVVINEITARLLSDAGKNNLHTLWLEDFIFSKMNDDKGWSIERELHLIAKELFKEDFRAIYRSEETITNNFVNELRTIKRTFELTMKSFGDDFLKTIRENNLDIEDFSFGKTGVAGYMEKLSRKIAPKEYEPGKRAKDTNENPALWSKKVSEKKDQVLSLVENKLRYILEDAINHYNTTFVNYNTSHEVLNLIHIAGIVDKLDEKLKEYRDENDILLISDTNLLLKDFISDEDTPFIYEKTGNRYKHFMIDEFQDTSAFQWGNIMPLIENSLAIGSSAMMVGDAKQSIYRWRGGKMQLLLSGIQDNLKHYAEIIQVENLRTNFRSKKEIVDFNNSFFSLAPSFLPIPEVSDDTRKNLTRAYHTDEVKQEILKQNSTGGYVEIIFYDEEEKIEHGNGQELSKNEIVLKQLLQTLDKLIKQGFETKDICILVRKNTHGNEISKFLFENGYKKIISSESLLINTAPQIVFLIHLMKLLKSSDDKIAKAECINYYLTKNDLPGNKEGHDIFSTVNNSSLFFKTLPEDFSIHFSRLRKLPLYELTEQLISIFKLNVQPDGYIQRFQDLILEYSDKNQPTLSSFLDWWEEKNESDKCSVIVPSNENAINIISIHKSKGLQFPVVILPFPDWELKPKADNILWVHSDKKPFSDYSLLPVKTTQMLEKSFFKEAYYQELQHTLIDNLNLLYVAFTRAEERLYLICPAIKTEKINRTSHLLCKVIESNSEWKNKMLKEKGLSRFSSGIESPKIKKSNSQTIPGTSFENPEIVSLKKYNSNPWQNKLVLTINKNKISIDDTDATQKSDFGILIHRILSRIILEEDADKVISESLLTGLIQTRQKDEIKRIIYDVLAICTPKKWFTNEWKIKTEAEIISPDSSVIRPDRVMIKNKKVVLLDYKTGAEDVFHKNQLNAYGIILLNSGYETVEKYLLYLKTMTLFKV